MSNKSGRHNEWNPGHGGDTTIQTFGDYELFVGNSHPDRYEGSDAKTDIAFGRSGNDALTGAGRGDDLIGGIIWWVGSAMTGSLAGMPPTRSWAATVTTI